VLSTRPVSIVSFHIAWRSSRTTRPASPGQGINSIQNRHAAIARAESNASVIPNGKYCNMSPLGLRRTASFSGLNHRMNISISPRPVDFPEPMSPISRIFVHPCRSRLWTKRHNAFLTQPPWGLGLTASLALPCLLNHDLCH